MLNRRDAVRRLLADRGGMLVVAGLGQPCYDCFAAGDDPCSFYLWGAMGGAVPMGLGLALAQPERRVLVVTGDGEALMSAGAFATVGAEAPENLAIYILDNERYGETGGQVTHTARGADLAAMTAAAGIPRAQTVHTEAGLVDALDALRSGAGPLVVVLKVAPESQPGALPPQDGPHLKRRFRRAALGVEDK
ncbi:MAG: thiamine pyrophosphate-dependent enzyme [Alphaproteobacteria bacterium]|nr:thiamine pyrophosphate-dependent enzyme [Alphaproteobacteria bacterium]MCY4229906.1 thiamine pyrophosphate-dependent enzyme [Alphaproteobacteria bacterium]MCY4319163.1 thiamine pyrophosphate-dependent enzyme [Alphaproteobacteria bacterium]